MTEKRKVDVTIDGRNFTVVGSESEDYIKSLAAYLDSKMKVVLEKNKKLSYSTAALLTAFNIADQYYKTSIRYDELKRKTKKPLEEYTDLKEKLKEAKEYIDKLESQIKIYEEELLTVKSENEENRKIKIKQEHALKLKEDELLEKESIIKDLQDKLFENQIDLIETKKELEEALKDIELGKNYMTKEDNQ